MKKYIFAALAAAAMTASAQNTVTNLVVETTDGVKTKFETSQIKEVTFADAPAYIEAKQFISATYQAENMQGQYMIDLGTCLPDKEGNPSEVGGVLASLCLVGPESESAVSAILPAGFYTAGTGQNFTFTASKSAVWIRTGATSDDVTVAPVIGGTVDVRHVGSGYEIRMELVTLTGESVNLSYQGDINFALGNSQFKPFTEPINVELEGLQGRFYGNWFIPFADDMLLQGWNGEFDSENAFKSGYWLNLPIYMPKTADPQNTTPKLADGVYTIEKRVNPLNNTYRPFTFEAGGVIDFMGVPYQLGAYITLTAEDGGVQIAYIVEGTLTVSENGNNVVLEGKTENGLDAKIVFKGKPALFNFCDNENSEVKRPWSTLTENYKLDFTLNTVGIYFMDDPTIVEGLNTYTFWITDLDMDKGDYLQFQLLTSNDGLKDGTYTVATTFADNTILPGWLGYGGDICGSWFADMDSASDGVATVVAPVTEGTFTISTEGDSRKIVFNLVDDNGKTITGEFKGLVVDGDEALGQAPRKSKIAKKTRISLK